MDRTALLKTAGVLFLIAIAVFVLTYFIFHYMQENGRFGKTIRKTPGKPFITQLFGVWGTVFLSLSIGALVLALTLPA